MGLLQAVKRVIALAIVLIAASFLPTLAEAHGRHEQSAPLSMAQAAQAAHMAVDGPDLMQAYGADGRQQALQPLSPSEIAANPDVRENAGPSDPSNCTDICCRTGGQACCASAVMPRLPAVAIPRGGAAILSEPEMAPAGIDPDELRRPPRPLA